MTIPTPEPEPKEPDLISLRLALVGPVASTLGNGTIGQLCVGIETLTNYILTGEITKDTTNVETSHQSL